jgi:hypothetical protein
MPFAVRARRSSYMRDYYARNRNAIRARQLSYERGPAYWIRRERKWRANGIMLDGKPLAVADFQAVLKYQGGVCAICGKDALFGPLQADHDHRTGAFRGGLCYDCNRMLGTFETHGRYKDELFEARLRAFLFDTPVRAWIRAGRPT